VNFFPKSEDISDYDYQFNRKKIDHWKEHSGYDFFLQQPLIELLPVLKGLNASLANYISVQEKLNAVHLETLSQMLPRSKTRKSKDYSYTSLMMMPLKSQA
jgi:hypothetical protein